MRPKPKFEVGQNVQFADGRTIRQGNNPFPIKKREWDSGKFGEGYIYMVDGNWYSEDSLNPTRKRSRLTKGTLGVRIKTAALNIEKAARSSVHLTCPAVPILERIIRAAIDGKPYPYPYKP